MNEYNTFITLLMHNMHFLYPKALAVSHLQSAILGPRQAIHQLYPVLVAVAFPRGIFPTASLSFVPMNAWCCIF